MQPDQAGVMEIESRRRSVDRDRVAVDSRRRALDRLWAALPGGLDGPVLITGEAGAGKNWLVGRLVEGLPAGWRSAEVELTSALDGLEMLRLVGESLGLEIPDRLGAARIGVAACLRDDAADGRNWLLVIDEVQRAAAGAWEEIQALCNRLGRPGGFAAMILLGRTELVRELATHRRRGWSGRLGLHIHLPPLDLDEARALLPAEGRLAESELEALHRDAMGNPRAMLRMAGAGLRASRPVGGEPLDLVRRPASSRMPGSRPIDPDRPSGDPPMAIGGSAAHRDEEPPPRLPSLIPARPPIRLEEGLVEVGWEGDLEAEPTRAEVPEGATAAEEGRDEELVEDRYAALQAWAEWSRNREPSMTPGADPAIEGGEPDAAEDIVPDPSGPTPGESGPAAASAFRAEPPQDFAPYSQLFSRLRHSL